jgi:hypothetical protein
MDLSLVHEARSLANGGNIHRMSGLIAGYRNACDIAALATGAKKENWASIALRREMDLRAYLSTLRGAA